MKLFRPGWIAFKWCAHCLGSFAIWTVWLVLTALLVLQTVIAFTHELRVPARVVRSFEDRLALAGLRIRFESASFDPSGHVLIEKARLYSDTFEEPLITAESVFVTVDPVALLRGQLQARSLHAQEATLYVPAMLSPSGRTEPALEDVTLRLRPGASQLELEQVTGRAGPLAINCHGQVHLPRGRATGPRPVHEVVAAAVDRYLRIAREITLAHARLKGVEQPSLELTLTPDEERGAIVHARLLARSADLSRQTLELPHWPRKVEVNGLRVATHIPVFPASGVELRLTADADEVRIQDAAEVRGARVQVSGQVTPRPFKIVPGEVLASVEEARAQGVAVRNLSARGALGSWPEWRVDATAGCEDTAWGVRARGNPTTEQLHVAADGTVSPALLRLAGERAGRDLSRFLTPESPIRVSAEADLAPDGRVIRAEGDLASGAVTAYRVPFDHASGHFQYAGQNVAFRDIVLAQGENLALGSYEMDLSTLDYRFLLSGRLRPIGIKGWFHDWWPRFWDNFDFAAAVPQADVDVQGRWRDPHRSAVFVHVDATRPAIRGVPFDLVRTTLFIRPHFYDALEIQAFRPEGSARGRFTRVVHPDTHEMRRLDFDVSGRLDLQESARIFGPAGLRVVEPFRFAQAPQLKLAGKIEADPARPGQQHESVDVKVSSSGAFWFYDFPLSNLSCRAQVNDHDIDVQDIRVDFAEGTAEGRARLAGEGDERRLDFDAAVLNAKLGESIRILEEFGAKRRGEPPPPISRFQQRVAGGRIDVRASASGHYQNLYSYVGQGTAELRGAELAEINLLGALSEALRGNSLLGFTSWSLDTATTRFSLEREKLQFSELTILGPSAKLEAHGTYGLDTKQMLFNAKFYPYDQGKTLLASAVDLVLTPVSAVLELKLAGSLDQPKWFFAYGPTNLIRKIAGTDEAKEPAPPADPVPPRVKAPPPFLRR